MTGIVAWYEGRLRIMNINDKLGIDAQVQGVDARDTIVWQAACSLHYDVMQTALRSLSGLQYALVRHQLYVPTQ
jgi:hypothetical protein